MDQTTIIQLLEQITPICIKAKQAHEERRKRGEFFNVFKILRERYIFNPIKEYAEKHDLKCDTSENEYFISLKKEDWEGEINIRPDKSCWKDMYIGITKACKETAKLDCLSEAPSRDWPFGWEYIEPKNWQDANNYPALKDKVEPMLEAKIEKILKEIEEKQITI